jgi:hypothetical protein
VPTGPLLYFYTLLPQTGTKLNGENIPPLFGKVKDIGFVYFFVGLLVCAEIYLIFFGLPQDGIPIMQLVLFSIADFSIGLVPIFFEKNPTWNISIIKSEMFIRKINIELNDKNYITDGSTLQQYLAVQETELNKLKTRKFIIEWIIKPIISIGIIGGFAYLKFSTYVEHYHGIERFFTDRVGSGAILAYSIVGGAIIHIAFTKTVIYHIICTSKLKKQKKEFKELHHTDFIASEKNKVKLIEYQLDFEPKVAGNQKLWQFILEGTTIENNSQITELDCNNHKKKFITNKVVDNKNVNLIWSGLLLDSEINTLFIQQPNEQLSKAVIAACKRQQILEIK